MDSFDSLTAGLLINNTEPKTESIAEVFPQLSPAIVQSNKLFDVTDFQTQLRNKVIKKNKEYHLNSENISGYDIASGCSRSVFYRINNIPTNNYANSWLPVEFRCHLGSSVHEFIQDNCNTFTEKEVCLKVPSKRISCRLDCLINNNVIVEIKSCNYKDLNDIIKHDRPRLKDFYQATLYKYLIENYLQEIKQQAPTRGGTIPIHDNYKIDHLQFIYVCHELISGESSTISEAVDYAKTLAKLNNSKKNPFWFIQTMNVDLSKVNITLYENLIKDKIENILYYLNNNIIPELDSKYIDKTACFFCLHSTVCKNQG